VALHRDQLRREVLGRAAEGVGAVGHLLGEAEVAELDETVAVQQYVLGLEIAIDDVPLVQVLEH